MNDSAAVEPPLSYSAHGLSDSPATLQHRYGALATCFTLAACAVLGIMFGSGLGPEIKPIVPVTTTVWSLADLLTGFLLLAQFCISGRVALAVMAVAYATIGLLSFGYLFTFPGLFSGRFLTPGDLNMFVYFGVVWHLLLPLLVIVSLLIDSPLKRIVSRRAIVLAAIATVTLPVAIAGLIAVGLFLARNALPYLVLSGQLQPVNRFVCHPTIITSNALAGLALLARGKRLTTLQLWLCVALFSACLDSVLIISTPKLYSYAWDIGKLLTVCSASAVLIMILCEITVLYSRQARLTERLEHDLRARKRAEAALRASDERFRQIEEHTPIGLALLALDGSLTRVNPALCALLGYSADDLLKIDRASLTHPMDRAAEYAPTASLLSGTIDSYDTEKRYIHKDGHSVWAHLSASLVRDESRQPLYVIAQIQDIGARKAAQEAIGIAQRSALAAAETKARFLATMSHEIRTPMNGIVGMAELLSLSQLDADQNEYINVVRDSGKSLLRVLDDILDYSKIEAGKLELEVVDFDLRSQVRSVVALLQPQFEAKGLSLTTQIESTVPIAVKGDPCRVRQILLNLVGNALKFTPTGGSVGISASAEPAASGLAPLRFTVTDSGVGIAPDVRHRLFQPFSQVDGSTTRIYGGTGLGLSICKQLVDLMQGTIGVKSELGSGSSFWFAIPFLPSSQTADVSAERTSVGNDRRAAARSRRERLLLADDNAINTLLAIKQFKQLGFDIAVVNNGQEAVDAFTSERFDVIFMDCHMPVMDGFNATRTIRELELNLGVRVPIVAMTANAQAEDREACLNAGMDDYVAKPVSLADLHAVLERWLPAGRQDAPEIASFEPR